AKYQEKKAENSWKLSVMYMEQYVLPWFLNKKHQNNVNSWHFLFKEFTDYLEDEAIAMRSKQKLAYSTKNKVIHTLNSFLTYLSEYNLIDPDAARKCPCFPADKLNTKTYENVITPVEFERVFSKLKELNAATAEFFYVLYHTGMRFNELFSLPMS